ncbi:type II toxin-antitoxin system death-on-curing family toxin [Nitratireductor sp. CH_MIT9313-5]|uniref:type II toxin-antitoxin system death-on-curing family toxin n=1 Tax=Nitratireductor sp. CH_MIT9313-5 TaxID=3107764 RepID=UPI00300B3425
MTLTFLTRRVVESIHDEQLARHGGARGIRDENGLESALAREEQKTNYGQPDIFELAAAYAFGLARNHAFTDGNKRTAIVSAATFLAVNGFELTCDNGTLYTFTMELSSGNISEEGAAAFFRDFTKPAEAS